MDSSDDESSYRRQAVDTLNPRSGERSYDNAGVLFSVNASADVDKPNIVLFLVDDRGVMDTSVPMLTDEDSKPKRYPWNDWYRTPNMERLAARGVRFSNFYSHNVCSPTRVSIMSGQNSARHR